MNDKNGVEIKCSNCTHHCRKDIDNLSCQHGDFYAFLVSRKALEARIAELESISIMSKNDDKIDTIKKRVDFIKPKAKQLKWKDEKTPCEYNEYIAYKSTSDLYFLDFEIYGEGQLDKFNLLISIDDEIIFFESDYGSRESAKAYAQEWLEALLDSICEPCGVAESATTTQKEQFTKEELKLLQNLLVIESTSEPICESIESKIKSLLESEAQNG